MEDDRPSEDVFILGEYDGEKYFKFELDSSEQDIATLTVSPDQVHTINQNFTELRRAVPAFGCYVPEFQIWIVTYQLDQFKVRDRNIYRPTLETTFQPGESQTVVHQIGRISTVTSSSTHLLEDEPEDPDNKLDPDSLRVSYETGAQRSAAVEHVRYDLIHPIFARVLAEVLAEGAGKYGEHNWELGFPIQTLFNHMLAHIFDYLGGDRSEDHLGHAACNIMFLVVEARMREKDHASHLRLENCELSPEMIAAIKDFQAERARKNDSKRVETIRSELNRLYILGKLHHRPGCTVPVKALGRNYFEDFAFSTLRSVLEGMSYKINSDDCIVDLEMKDKNGS